MTDQERITRLEIRCEQLQLTVNEAFHWIDILKSDLSDLQDRVGQADRKTEPNLSDIPTSSDEPETERYCTNCKHNGVIEDYECRECHGMDKHEFIEPQTETPTNSEKVQLKVQLTDEPQTERRCGNCKFLTYRFNKVWCDIKCDNPHDVVCDKWERSSE